VDLSNEEPDTESAEALADAVAGAALALLLVRRGGQLDITPGNPASVRLGGHDVKPFGLLLAMKNGQMPGHSWVAQCVQLGIAGTELASGA